MSKHQKRLAVPKSWPVERKTETYTTKAGAGPHGADGVPLLIVLRDVLGYVDSTKEARYALGQDSVLVNGTAVSDERRPIGMFDILAFTERDEYYRVFPDEGGRLSLTPIDAESADSKLGKIVGKQQVPGGDTQLALHDGRTLLVDDATTYGSNDSIVVANDDDEIVAHFTYEEGALVTAVRGRHAGRIGTVDEIQVTPGSSANNVLIAAADGDDFETVEEYVVVIDENFVDDDADVGDVQSAEDEALEEDAEDEGTQVDEEDEEDVEEDDVEEDAEDEEDADDEDETEGDGVEEDAEDEQDADDENEEAGADDAEADETDEAEADDETDEAEADDETDEAEADDESEDADVDDDGDGGDDR